MLNPKRAYPVLKEFQLANSETVAFRTVSVVVDHAEIQAPSIDVVDFDRLQS